MPEELSFLLVGEQWNSSCLLRHIICPSAATCPSPWKWLKLPVLLQPLDQMFCWQTCMHRSWTRCKTVVYKIKFLVFCPTHWLTLGILWQSGQSHEGSRTDQESPRLKNKNTDMLAWATTCSSYFKVWLLINQCSTLTHTMTSWFYYHMQTGERQTKEKIRLVSLSYITLADSNLIISAAAAKKLH